MPNVIDITFITVNYNGSEDTIQLIKSLKANLQHVTYEIIVVDNASTNDEASIIKQSFPDVLTIRSENNLGFAGGNNLALSQAKGRYLMFINNDTYIEDDNFDALINRLESNEKIAMVCPKLRFAWGNRPIQFAGFSQLSRVTLRNVSIGIGENDTGQYEEPHPTPFAHGAAMMISRDILNKIGQMWEGYFLYYEEMDWSESIRRAGYEIWYEPKCVVFHKESRSVGTNSPTKVYYLTRNRLLFAKRNRTGFERFMCYVYLTTIALLFHFTKYVFSGKFKLANSVRKGLLDFYF